MELLEGKKGKVLRLISRAKGDCDFGGEVGGKWILFIEKQLDVSLSEGYKWYVRKFGSGGIGGIDILGIDPYYEVSTCVRETERVRKSGLPKHYVVIQSLDESRVCLDTSKMKNGECPVVFWDGIEGSHDGFDDFLDFLIVSFESILEDIEYENEIN
ncbi:SMI1/KNR4 family protein [Mechercharimyces sp. CAU 1602]|uniref:SMI1/KNR4 family protein n=1 Tax=Mechercharimyces sp. CAU 1602 TaxID=2973933 RepID=UPI0021630D16|nr:SMI1/KNR4 family protein [Mechercharimyces sp. CAU 1602]MCS1351406.1 SMI1/KNR4 family protein [Mechercharimyces sp. CAU 1602]